MMKIFSTQLQGQFKKIMEQEEARIEDGSRVLAQSIISEGRIFVYGVGEMEAVVTEALVGAERFPSAVPFEEKRVDELTDTDRVLIVSRFSTDNEAVRIAEMVREKGVQTVAISAVSEKEHTRSLASVVDIHIDSKLTKPLLPDEDGTRYGFPTIITALFAYYGLAFTVKEMLAEFE